MENLVGVINDLQDAFAGVDERLALELPQIAVVGCQSAGKSSVLENIVGRDFLPRGSGIVTRRPLILQLVRLSGENDNGREYGEFLHKRNEQFYDFHQIRKEIENETERLCGSNKGVSSAPINLRIYSDRVLDLTLIDLPGMTKVPVGDQPQDIEIQIRQLIMQFVEPPNCLILAVSPANADLANSDALQLAREVDPDGVRTIAVLTKLDLMDEGTDARAVLRNEVVPLRYGYIGVVNRSQKDIEGQKDIQAALQAEQEYFSSHPSYSDMADRMGTPYLRKALHFHLTRHIADSLPDLRSKLELRCIDLERRLADRRFGGDLLDITDYDDPYWKAKTLVSLVIKFAHECRAELLGSCNDIGILNYDGLSCGARINQLFHVNYPSLLADVEFAKEIEMKRAIGYAIENINGVRTALFTPDKAFEQIIRKQIGKLRHPTVTLIDMTMSEINKAVDSALQGMKRFPGLARYMESLVSNFVLSRVERTRDAANELLDYEHAYVNARHEDFVGFKHAERTAERIVCERKNPGMQVLKSGWLSMSTPSTLFGSRKYWFVLTPDNLSWYTDATLQECKYRIPMDDGRLRFIDHEKNNEFSLIGESEKHNIYKDCNRLDMVAPSYEQFDDWRAGFTKVGVFCSSQSASAAVASVLNKTPVSAQILDSIDPHLERQIEIIWVLIASYMRIVCRTLEDMIPKVVARLLIKDTVEYLEKRFVADVSRLQNVDELMEEDAGEAEERKKLQKRYAACRMALEKLHNVKVPKSDFVPFEAKSVRVNRTKPTTVPSQPRPAIPPRPIGVTATDENGGQWTRSGSVATRRPQEEEGNVGKQKISTGQEKQPMAVAAETKEFKTLGKERASWRAPRAKQTTGQVQKAQSQIDSSQKSTFYIG